MFTKPEDFAKSGVNFALFFANTTFVGIERLALLNLAAARSVFEASMANFSPSNCDARSAPRKCACARTTMPTTNCTSTR